MSHFLVVVSHKRGSIPGVRQANLTDRGEIFVYFMFAQRWVLGDNSIKLAHHTQELQCIYPVKWLVKTR